MSLRFCFLTTFFPPYHFGGDGVLVYNLAQELALRGHRVEVVHCVDSFQLLSAHPPDFSAWPVPLGVKVHPLKTRVGPLSPLITHLTGLPGFKKKALQAILDQGFDVVHFHNTSLIGPASIRMAQGLRLYTAHEFWLECPTHHLLKNGEEICEDKSCFSCCLRQRRPPQLWRYTDQLQRSLSALDALLCPSEFLAERHRKLQPPCAVEVLPNFAESRFFESRESPKKGYFLAVGRLEPLKGIRTLIEVFRTLAQEELVIVGSGSQESELRQQAAGLSNVTFLGNLSPEKLPRIYSQAKALLFPSRWFEVFPLVLLEALASGTPIVVNDLGEAPRLARRSQAGLVFSSEEELRKIVLTLSDSPLLVKELGDRGRRFARSHYTPQSHLERYFALLERLGEKRRGAQ